MLNWHRLFGLFLIDYFTDSPYVVELEKDLSIKQQFLDVVVLRKGPGQFQGQLPDGLDNLAIHNLRTYKSQLIGVRVELIYAKSASSPRPVCARSYILHSINHVGGLVSSSHKPDCSQSR